MSILVDSSTNVLVQGITGHDGSFHTAHMLEYSTRVAAGVVPGKGGRKVHGVPVYSSVRDALDEHSIDASVIFVPAPYATAAVREAADAGIGLIVCITEGIPVTDMLQACHYVRERNLRLIGPNCPGLITPGQCKIGIMPGRIHRPGNIGVLSRSGTLTYEIVYNLTVAGMGQSTCIGVGGDPVIGSSFAELLELYEQDPGTRAVVMIGEIGGEDEERAAELIAGRMTKPVVAFISGRTAPEGKRMGHAGAIVSGGRGTAQAKIDALTGAGVPVADRPDQVPGLIEQALSDKE
jgi:succinyl-CoA synthetase alpha subunit